MRHLAALALVLLLAAVGGGAARAAPAMWVVKSPTATVYLFGTMHALAPDASWRTPAFEDAYAKADVLWFETDVSGALGDKAAATLAPLLRQYGLDPGHPLSTKLDAEHLSQLKAVAESDHLPFARLDVMRPWAAAAVVMAAPMVKAGFDPKAGADVQLMVGAAGDHKQTRFFETLDQQMHVFADLTPAAETQLLDDTMDEAARSADQIKAMQSAWLDGDLVRFGPLVIGALKTRYPDFYAALIQRRNQAFADAIAKELAGDRIELVSVGALHMVGDDGLPALLKARGFEVSRVQ